MVKSYLKEIRMEKTRGNLSIHKIELESGISKWLLFFFIRLFNMYSTQVAFENENEKDV